MGMKGTKGRRKRENAKARAVDRCLPGKTSRKKAGRRTSGFEKKFVDCWPRLSAAFATGMKFFAACQSANHGPIGYWMRKRGEREIGEEEFFVHFVLPS